MVTKQQYPFYNNEENIQNNNFGIIRRFTKQTILFFLIIVVCATAYSVFHKQGGITLEVGDDTLGVVGSYESPVFIPYKSITEISLEYSLEIGELLDGNETNNTFDGNYNNTSYGNYRLTAFKNVDAYIVIRYDTGNIFVFNQKSIKNTEKIYQAVCEKLPASS